MALSIDATVGGANSNSYATIAEIDDFVLSNPHDDTWTEVSAADKIAYAIMACRVMNEQMDWYGWVAAETQALDFPRGGLYDKDGYTIADSVIPTDIKNGQAELARLLVSADRTADADTKGFKGFKVGPINVFVDKFDRARAKILATSVYNILQWYGDRTTRQTRLLERV